MASLWQLPIVFVCENNGWSEFSPTKDQFAAPLGKLANAFNIAHTLIDGNDVEAVADAAQRAVGLARPGKPQVLECKTHRVRGHYEGDPQKYRAKEELDTGGGIDPIERAESLIQKCGVSQIRIKNIIEEIEQQVAAAVEKSRAGVEPEYQAAFHDVYTSLNTTAEAAHG